MELTDDIVPNDMWRLHPSYGNSSFISTGFLFIVLFVSRTGFAQLTRGTISGTVADSTNSVITNALVTARSLSTSQERQVRTNQERSEEHTSELQSLAYLVCRLLLEKK